MGSRHYAYFKSSSPADKTRVDKTLSLCKVCTVLNNIENRPIGEWEKERRSFKISEVLPSPDKEVYKYDDHSLVNDTPMYFISLAQCYYIRTAKYQH